MLFIYGALPVGGIETFFVRMAKERKKLGLQTSILLLSKPESSNAELLSEMRQYAQVFFSVDLFLIPPFFSQRFPLLSPVKKQVLRELFKRVDQIHVFDGMHALLGHRLSKLVDKSLPITIGFYHYIKYIWGGDRVAHFEKMNRKFVFYYLPQDALMMFSEEIRRLYTKNKKMNFDKAQIFRLGVVDKKQVDLSGVRNTPLKMVAIGRLVEFKTYNFYMLDVLNLLREKGLLVRFDIYGDGPLKNQIQEKIDKLNLNDLINLKGTLEYSKFDQVVSQYDLFIGSGTAIIQAASLGVPSIVGVENVIQPKTYGYFSDVHQYEYNLKGLDLSLISVEKMIEDYSSMNESERFNLNQAHLDSIEAFTNEACQKSMDTLKNIKMPTQPFKFNRWVYELSRIMDRVNMKLNKKHAFTRRHEDFKKNEN
ncbi:MAG: glycosyltransferase family 4 protein [Methyloprofundus sp.]|nr:glycosyltransferase family 4 protein [Methyloprofundus sp.]